MKLVSPLSASTDFGYEPRHLPLVSTRSEFHAEARRQIDLFAQTALVRKAASGLATIGDYHAILVTLFHQTRSSPYTFAKAGAHCPWTYPEAKEYLVVHANEELIHWQWVLDDLNSTGYRGPDPRTLFPHPTCAAYVSYNETIAVAQPVARLAIATVLEGIGATHGSTYGSSLLDTLGISVGQASFFMSHGETDKTHIQDLHDIIDTCDFGPEQWGWMTQAARVGGALYRAMYDHEAFR